MQHGTDAYHRDVAAALAAHLRDHVLPRVSPGGTPALAPERLCVGSWGSGPRSPENTLTSDVLAVGETDFQMSSPLSRREDKRTLNTNATSSTVRLDCPAPYNAMILGHVAHSDYEESATFVANGRAVSTHDPRERRPHVRTRQYTARSFRTPVDIFVSSLRLRAYAELTDVVCTAEA